MPGMYTKRGQGKMINDNDMVVDDVKVDPEEFNKVMKLAMFINDVCYRCTDKNDKTMGVCSTCNKLGLEVYKYIKKNFL